MIDALVATTAGLTWIAACYRLWTFRKHDMQPGQQGLIIALFALAVAVTTEVSAVYLWLGRVSHVPNVAAPLGHGSVLIAAWAATIPLTHSTFPVEVASRRVHRRLAVLIALLAAMVALFLSGGFRPQVLEFDDAYGGQTPIAVYYLIYVAVLGAAATDIARLCWRYARVADRDLLRAGLYLIATSGLLVLSYTVLKAERVVGRWSDVTVPLRDASALSEVLVALATILALAGTTATSWGPRLRLDRLLSFARNRRTYRRLSPLWWDVYTATPAIALYPPRSRRLDALDPRDIDFRLQRRVVEIQDGWLALRPYLDPEIALAARAALPTADDPQALEAGVQAAVLAAAVDAKTAGKFPGAGDSRAALPTGIDPTSETAWLETVARAYRRDRSGASRGLARKLAPASASADG